MRKRVLALLCVLAILVSFAVPAMAEEPQKVIVMEATATSADGATERELTNLFADDIVTVKLILPAGTYQYLTVGFTFDNAHFEVTSVDTELEEATRKDSGWGVLLYTEPDDANRLGSATITGQRTKTSSNPTPANGEYASQIAILIVTLKVKPAFVGSTVPFRFMTEQGKIDLGYYDNETNTSIDYTCAYPDPISASIVEELGTIELAGNITPVKGGTPVTALSHEKVDASITWMPNDNPFKPDTAYTAEISVTPKEGYVFGESTSVTFGEEAFTRSGDKFVKTITFPKTEDKQLPSVTTAPTAAVTYGDAVTDAVIQGSMNIPGSFAWKNVSSYGDAGEKTLTATFTPAETYAADYASCDVDVAVAVAPASISGAQFDAVPSQTWTGEAITPTPALTRNGTALVLDTDYTLSYENNVNVGSAAIKASGIGNYTGSAETTFAIVKADNDLTLSVPSSVVYGDVITYTTNVTPTRKMIQAAGDAAQVYVGQKLPVGTYTVWAELDADDNHNAATSTAYTVEITPRPINDTGVAVEPVADQTYTGAPITFDAAVSFGGETLAENTDYTVSGNVATDAGKYTMTITGSGNFTGSRLVSYRIAPMSLGDISGSVPNVTGTYVYTGAAHTPGAEQFTHQGQTLKNGVDYTISYENNVSASTESAPAKVIYTAVSGKNYTFDTVTKEFTIQKAKIELSLNVNYKWVPTNPDDAEKTNLEFDYDGNEHGVKVEFIGDTLTGKVEIDRYDMRTAETNAGGYTAGVRFKAVDSDNYTLNTAYTTVGWKINSKNLDGTFGHTVSVRYDDASAKTVSLKDLGLPIDTDYAAKPESDSITIADENGILANASFSAAEKAMTVQLKSGLTKDAVGKSAAVTLTLWAGNYKTTAENGWIPVTLTVSVIDKTDAGLTVSGISDTLTYGDYASWTYTVQNPGTNGTISCTVDDRTILSLDGPMFTVTGAKVGSANVIITYHSDETYAQLTIPVTVTKREATAEIGHADITYGDPVPTDGYTMILHDVLDADRETLLPQPGTAYQQGDPVGAYAFTCVLSGAAADNYSVKVDPANKLTVTKKSLSEAQIVLAESDQERAYTGSAIEPVPASVTLDGRTLALGTDYTLSYEKNITVGTASIILTGKGNYKDTAKTTFTIIAADLSQAVIGDIADQTYTGSPITPDVQVAQSGRVFVKGTDYDVSYSDNTDAGTATVTVTGKGNFTGTAEKQFTILPADMRFNSAQTIILRATERNIEQSVALQSVYGVKGEVLNPACSLTMISADAIFADGKAPAISGGSVAFTPNGELGTASYTVSLAASKNYRAGSFTLIIRVISKDDVSAKITFPNGSAVYTGTGIKYENAVISQPASGTVQKTYTYTADSATASLDKNGLPLTVGVYTVTFTYSDDVSFGSAAASFTITKAAPSGKPSYTQIKTGGMTLNDANLGVGTITPAGTIRWNLPVSTIVEPNVSYAWTFTPADSVNYSELTGSVVLYDYRSAGGAGSIFPTRPSTSNSPFADVRATDYFYDAVRWAVKYSITSGKTASLFGPEDACTRAQTVTFLWRAAGCPQPARTANPFRDVKPGDYYYTAVLWAVEQGITNGVSATMFGPDETVSRGQVAAFLFRASGTTSVRTANPFVDVKPDAYNYDAIRWAYDYRITTGTSAATFSPDAPCTRAQIVTFLYRFYNLSR